MRPVSKKRAGENRKRKKVTDAMKREGNVMCQFVVWEEDELGTDHGTRCNLYADDCHEIVSRARGGSITDLENLVPLCREHHRWVTEHPLEAERLGLSRRKE